MMMQKPKTEFIKIDTDSVIATSGAGYSYCQNQGQANAMDITSYCDDMETSMSRDDYCNVMHESGMA